MRTRLLALLLAICGTPYLLAFDFYDASGRRYRSAHLEADIQRRYGFHSSPFLVLVQTPSLNHSDCKRQMAILSQLDGERLNLVYVVSSLSGIARHGYHTTPKTAAEISSGANGFRVTLLTSTGAALKSADEPFSASELMRMLEQHRKPVPNAAK